MGRQSVLRGGNSAAPKQLLGGSSTTLLGATAIWQQLCRYCSSGNSAATAWGSNIESSKKACGEKNILIPSKAERTGSCLGQGLCSCVCEQCLLPCLSYQDTVVLDGVNGGHQSQTWLKLLRVLGTFRSG
ncbi:hypothetical protein UY3_16528 [Chelonia mydas]|uniref:Uncharacterized protein n=1 Tax=Chelonia mydas TaxID=8469 RepID=M7APA0_CHEMY|nr:hypothetical protein UY3_16528 [Chelonia mydas]